MSKSKRILVIGDSMSLAHVTRAMVLARRLEQEGARVFFATGPAHQALARQEGFEPHEIFCVPPEQAYAAIRRGSHVFDLATVKRYVASDLDLCRKLRPDLVIGDMRVSLNISAELAGIEYWSILSGYLTRYYSAQQRPPTTLPLVRLLGDRLSRAVFPVLKILMRRYHAYNFHRYRKQLGLQSVNDIFDFIASPYRNLIADLPCFIPCKNLPPNFEYIGPLLWEPNVPEPRWMDQLRTNVPTVYVSMGSTGVQDYFSRILRCLREAGWQVVATTGRHEEVMSSSVFAVPYARGTSLLKRSQLLVCHGGSGTIYQAVSEGVPIVGIGSFFDQEINMERVEALDWGMALDPVRWSEGALLEAIRRLQSPTCRAAIAEGQSALRAFIREQGSKPLLAR